MQMRARDLAPDLYTYHLLLAAYGKAGQASGVRTVQADMAASGLRPNEAHPLRLRTPLSLLRLLSQYP